MILLCGCGDPRSSTPTVRVVSAASFVFFPLLLAQQLGYYEQEGIRVTFANTTGSSKALEAILGGSADVATAGSEHSIQLAAEGQSVKSFMLLFRGVVSSMVVSPKSKKQIAGIEDLRGASVGVIGVGSQTHFMLNSLLARRSISPAEVSTTPIGLGATAVAALEQGRVDAGFISPASLVLLKRRHPELRILFDPQSDEFFRSYPTYALCATSTWLSKNPSTVRKFARAVIRASRVIRERPVEEIVALLPPEVRSEDPTADIEVLRKWRDAFSADGVIPPDSFEAVRQVVALTVDKVRTAKIDPRDVYTNEFVTDAK
jgi:NitT/TauT family transport system substrate-binding protein